MRFLSAAIFAAACLVCVVAGATVGAALSGIALQAFGIGPTGRPPIAAGIGGTVAFLLLMALYLKAIRPRRNNALHRLWVALRRSR
jgi:hypothetical protein